MKVVVGAKLDIYVFATSNRLISLPMEY